MQFELGTPVRMEGRGVGRIDEVNLDLGSFKIAFDNGAELRVGFAAAPKLLDALPKGHFLRDRIERPNDLRKLKKAEPAELLRRRPDIRLSERQLAGQSALIGVAKADLYPHFSLFGSLGFQTASSTDGRSNHADFSDWFKGESFTLFAGPGVSWDIFNYGRLTNRVRVEDARFQELAVNYEDTVLRAAQEVEDAMVSFLRNQDSVGFLADAVKASKRSVDLSMIQYREGLTDYQRVLDTQRFLTAAQDDLVATAGSVNLSLIAIYKALGGGWELRAANEFVAKDIIEEMEQRTDWGDLLSPDELETPPSEEVKAIFHSPDF